MGAPNFPDSTTAKKTQREAKEIVASTETLLGALEGHEGSVRKLYSKARKKNIDIYLSRLPLYALKEVGASNVRTSALEKAGVRTVGDVLGRGPSRLHNIQGVGPHSAQTAYDAAKRIRQIAEKKLPVHLDDDIRPKEEEKLLRSVTHVREAHIVLGGIKREAEEVRKELALLAKKARPASRWWQRAFLSKERKRQVVDSHRVTANYVEQMRQSGLYDAIFFAANKVDKIAAVDSASLWANYHAEPETFDTLLRGIIGFVPDDADQLPLGRPPESGTGPRDGITTVYRMFDHREKLLYVGISNRVDARIEQHRSTKEWFWQVERIATVNYPDRTTALNVEKHAIKNEKPVYNIVHNR